MFIFRLNTHGFGLDHRWRSVVLVIIDSELAHFDLIDLLACVFEIEGILPVIVLDKLEVHSSRGCLLGFERSNQLVLLWFLRPNIR